MNSKCILSLFMTKDELPAFYCPSFKPLLKMFSSFQASIVSCKMRQTAPRREQLNRVQWFNDRRNGKDIFRLRMPKITERNGRICCLRVVVVKMREGQTQDQLPGLSHTVIIRIMNIKIPEWLEIRTFFVRFHMVIRDMYIQSLVKTNNVQ